MRWVEVEHEYYIPLPAHTWCSGCANALPDDMAKSPILPRQFRVHDQSHCSRRVVVHCAARQVSTAQPFGVVHRVAR